MGFTKMGENLGFVDLSVSKSLEQDHSLKMIEKINAVVECENIEAMLLEHYEVGKSKADADAFFPCCY
jgi:hypothetical protein